MPFSSTFANKIIIIKLKARVIRLNIICFGSFEIRQYLKKERKMIIAIITVVVLLAFFLFRLEWTIRDLVTSALFFYFTSACERERKTVEIIFSM